MKKLGLFLLLISFVFIVAACNDTKHNEESQPQQDQLDQTDTKTLEKELEDLNEELAHKDEELIEMQNEIDNLKVHENYMKEELDFYKKFAEKAVAMMSEKELTQLSSDHWTYMLVVNNEVIPNDGNITANAGEVSITLSEKQKPFFLVPIEYIEKSKISGNYLDHIFELNEKADAVHHGSGTIVDSVLYVFDNLEKGDVITFTVSDELRDRLGLATNKITITIK
ncbi:hypothetical protein CIB95_04285 [Lottiidibacillus patelloidae]|uniref:DUF4352 domain-containing protein n=1 Tax=Lottiidibacillus patelloidae TaxID=2670334 RepID=A0A263BV73_9BACI|nr:hypothetical protein [Lottiidibacillus patelloidae]OZM57595.1 hypothetical protein CIB95_04285 [Lottiidibacillus patelloidae]